MGTFDYATPEVSPSFSICTSKKKKEEENILYMNIYYNLFADEKKHVATDKYFTHAVLSLVVVVNFEVAGKDNCESDCQGSSGGNVCGYNDSLSRDPAMQSPDNCCSYYTYSDA